MLKQIAVVLVPLAVLAGCATPETRVRTALMDAGVNRPVASCMAQRMVDRLSLAQLQRLSRLGAGGRRIADMSITDVLRRVRGLGDPQIVSVVTTAGLGCAIAS